jgi:hypothetical protein
LFLAKAFDLSRDKNDYFRRLQTHLLVVNAQGAAWKESPPQLI